jgi:hypothetical protein
MGFSILVIDESIHNHPLKKFVNEDQEAVMILIGAGGTNKL